MGTAGGLNLVSGTSQQTRLTMTWHGHSKMLDCGNRVPQRSVGHPEAISLDGGVSGEFWPDWQPGRLIRVRVHGVHG